MYAPDVALMEACDLLGGLRLADEMGIHAVAVEFDSLKVV